MTAPKNPSEFARLLDEVEDWKAKAFNLSSPKSARELSLRELRKLERQLGIEGENYNAH